MRQIDECHEILADPYGYTERLKRESGRKIIGTFCSYMPEEFVIAAGAHPLKLNPIIRVGIPILCDN